MNPSHGRYLVLGIMTIAPPTGAAAQAMRGRAVPAGEIFARGRISAKDDRRVERVQLDSAAAGWVLTLEIADPKALDLDLYVFAGSPEVRGPLLCRSEGIEAVETCRLVPAPGEISVVVAVSDGEGKTDYTLSRRPLRGPRLAGTASVADDAQPLRPGVWTDFSSGRGPVLYRLPPGRWVVAAGAADPQALIDLAVFDANGTPAGRSTTPSFYQDLPGPPPEEGGFLLVEQHPASFRVGAFPAERSIPATPRDGDFLASGRDPREFEVHVDAGQVAVIRMEGPNSRLLVKGDQGDVPIEGVFGATVQAAWVGEPVGNSRAVLGPVRSERALHVMVMTEPGSYQSAPNWLLHVHLFTGQPNYLVRFGTADIKSWERDERSMGPTEILRDEVPAGGLRVYVLPAPKGQGAAPAPPSSIRQQAFVPTRAAQYARLTEEASKMFDLAVCTGEGRVLDIGGASVRWDWSPDLDAVFLVVFPDPANPAQSGGPFELQLVRALSGR